MSKMKAARWYAPKDLRVEQVDAPTITDADDVIIKVKYCGICGTDLHEYRGPAKSIPVDKPHPLTGHKAPGIMGHEISGVVTEVGSNVTNVKPGDRVCVMPLHRCGKCYFCQRGLYQLCVMQAGTGLQYYWGGFAEYVKLHSYNVFKIPDSMSFRTAGVVELTAIAVYAMQRGNVRPGDTVFISGGGPSGVLHMMAAFAYGAKAVYMAEVMEGRRSRLVQFGATEAFDPTACDIEKEIRDRTDGLGVDVAIDCSGSQGGMDSCFNVLRKRGMYVQSGLATRRLEVDAWKWAENDFNMCGIWCYDTYDFPRVIDLVANGAIPAEKAITAVYSLDDVVKGFEELSFDKEGKHLKILVKVDESEHD